MTSLPTAPCARCAAPMPCGAATDLGCWCESITLDAALLARLRQAYSSCLCRSCLEELASQVPGRADADAPRPTPRSPGRA